MQLNDMQIGIWYVVVTDGDSFKSGERIRQLDDGTIIRRDTNGWLHKEEWQNARNEIAIDKEFYVQEIQKHIAAIEYFRQILKTGE